MVSTSPREFKWLVPRHASLNGIPALVPQYVSLNSIPVLVPHHVSLNG